MKILISRVPGIVRMDIRDWFDNIMKNSRNFGFVIKYLKSNGGHFKLKDAFQFKWSSMYTPRYLI